MHRAAAAIAALACLGTVTAQAPGLYISEVMEGSGFNKAVEIYNPTQATIMLSAYKLGITINGGNTIERNFTFASTATVAAGGTYTVCHSSISPSFAPQCDLLQTFTTHNGDDAYSLVYSGMGPDVVIDRFGSLGADPGRGFTVCGVGSSTADNTLVRKPSVVSGNTNWTLSSGTNLRNCEWIIRPQNDFSNGGTHTCVLPFGSLFISEVMEGSGFNKSVELYNPSRTALDLTQYTLGKTVNGGTTLENNYTFASGTTLGAGATFTLCSNRIATSLQSRCTVLTSFISHNGDDVYSLVDNRQGAIIDTFGRLGADPGRSFTVCNNTVATVDTTLIRKPTIFHGNPNWGQQGNSADTCEWLFRSQDDFSNGGVHSCVLPGGSLFISEVMEGTSFNKAVELYNPTTAAIDLSNYLLGKTVNGGFVIENNYSFPAGTMIASGGTYTLCNPSVSSAMTTSCTVLNSYISHNGDDVYLLVEMATNAVIDTFGTLGADPGRAFSICGDRTATADNTLVRKPTVVFGNPNWSAQNGLRGNVADCEWSIRPVNDFTNGGAHTSSLPLASVPGTSSTSAPTTAPVSSAPSTPPAPTVSPTAAPTAPTASPTPWPAPNPATATLFFSEIMEGTSFNKAIEVYNPTTTPIALDNYYIGQINNGGAAIENILNFTAGAMVPSGGVFTFCNSAIAATFRAQCSAFSSRVFHNGDDAVLLVRRADNVTIDTFGMPGPDPGRSWTVCGNTRATVDATLVRKPVIFRGNPDWVQQTGFTPVDCEWLIRPTNDFTNGGAHACVLPTNSPAPTPAPVTTAPLAGSVTSAPATAPSNAAGPGTAAPTSAPAGGGGSSGASTSDSGSDGSGTLMIVIIIIGVVIVVVVVGTAVWVRGKNDTNKKAAFTATQLMDGRSQGKENPLYDHEAVAQEDAGYMDVTGHEDIE